PVEYLSLRSFYGPSMLACGWRFVRLLRHQRVDVVHAHDVYSNIFVSVWARLGGARVVIASRRWWHSSPDRKLQIASRFAFSRATAVLANSPQVARSVADESRVPASKIWTVTNFADDSAFAPLPDEERDRLRRQWNVPENAVVVGCVARLDPFKDHRTLLRAFAAARSRVPELFLVLVGGGGERSALEALARDLGVDGSVHFTGELRTGENYHRAFDISALA